MRHAVIKFTNTTSVALFGLLMVLMPRTVDPDLAPPAPVEFVSHTVERPYVSRIVPLARPNAVIWKVEWSDGVKKFLWPCKFEDSRRCYWQADVRGNQVGRSFIHARKRTWFVNYAD